ncbi:hypothetical protein CAEBREN_15853 [Caenorhabditis brenneri]|uniref:Uncharacterized protein n=1 Tax=Caenorhabditis brenneri TaxID=135651 RepID=G0MDR6_CAEBE|nr:hypothetical protein CAEBREN_15853 [Caenorhabditis brenneri]
MPRNNRSRSPPAYSAPSAPPTTPVPMSDAFDLPSLENLCLTDDNKKMSEAVQHSIVLYMNTSDRLHAASALPGTFGELDRVVPHRIKLLKFEPNAITVNSQRVYLVHQFVYLQRRLVLCCTRDLDEQGQPLNIRLPANQKLKEGDIVIVRREDDPYKEDLAEPNRIQERPSLVVLRKIMQVLSVAPIRELPVPLPDGIKFPDAMRNLSKQILSGDRVHVVDNLIIGFREGIIRLPVGVQLKVRKLLLNYNALEAMKAIRPIIHPASWPLEDVTLSVDDPRDPIIRELPDARHITVCLTHCIGRSDWRIFAFVRRPHIHLAEAEINVQDWCWIAQSWKSNPPPIGQKFSMNSKNNASDYIDGVKILGGVIKMLPSRSCIKYPYCTTIPLSKDAELNFYGAKAPFYELEMKWTSGDRILWMAVMEVMPVGSAEDAVD